MARRDAHPAKGWAAGFGRYSAVSPRGNQDSEEIHTRVNRDTAARYGLKIKPGHEFYDRGITGAKSDVRLPDLEPAIRVVVKQEVEALIVPSLDRLSRRGMRHVGEMLDAVEGAAGRIIFGKDNLDSANPGSRAIIAFLAEQARAESQAIAWRIEQWQEPATAGSRPAPDGMAHPMGGWTGHLVDRKVWGTGVIAYAGAHYSVGRPFVGQTVRVGCAGGMVQIFHGGHPLRAWPRRHPPANEASIQPARSPHGEIDLDQARRLAPLNDLDSDPRVVHRLVDPRGLLSFAARYDLAARYLAGQVVQVRCAGGIVQIIHGGELVRAWQQRHTPQQEQRMHQRPNIQQRTANARALTSPPQQAAPAGQP